MCKPIDSNTRYSTRVRTLSIIQTLTTSHFQFTDHRECNKITLMDKIANNYLLHTQLAHFTILTLP